jgi:hypothetical protein
MGTHAFEACAFDRSATSPSLDLTGYVCKFPLARLLAKSLSSVPVTLPLFRDRPQNLHR